MESTPLHKHRQILEKFCQSVKGDMTHSLNYEECDVAVVFGSWKKESKKEWKIVNKHHALKNKIFMNHRGPLIVIETPLLGRTITDNHEYHRVGLGHFMRELGDFKNKNSKPDRFDKLGLKIKPWRNPNNKDGHVLIVGQNMYDASLFGIDFEWWVMNTIMTLMKHTKRKIIFRDHPENKNKMKQIINEKFSWTGQVEYSGEGKINDDLKKAHCTVSFTSGSSIDSILAGVPVITCSEYNFLWPISSHSLEEVEYPKLGDREQLLYDLAYAQWSVKEICEGKPWKHLIDEN